MGHNIKTKNRTEAINRNAARTQTLAEKISELGGHVAAIRKELIEQVELIIKEMDEFNERLDWLAANSMDRLDQLERPIWRKIMDKMKEVVDRGDPAKPANKAILLDIHSVRHTAHSTIVKTDQKGKEVKDDGTKVEPSDS